MSRNSRRGLDWKGLAVAAAALALLIGGGAEAASRAVGSAGVAAGGAVAAVADAAGAVSGGVTLGGGEAPAPLAAAGSTDLPAASAVAAGALAEAATVPGADARPAPDIALTEPGTVQQEAIRSGGYRSPSGSFSGGSAARGGTSIGGAYRSGQRTPSSNVTRTPRTTVPGGGTAYTPGRTGSFLGGLATGAILGHLLNPFSGFGWGGGYGYGAGGGFGFSMISLLIWAVLLYAVYRIIRRLFGGRGGGGRYR